MKKLSTIVSLFLMVGLFSQGAAFAAAKTNFGPKKKHPMAATSTLATPAPAAPTT